MKVAHGALAADLFHFGIDDFPSEILFQNCFKIVVFRFGMLWRRDPGLELQIAAMCGAIVHHSIALCNSVSADRIGMAASRFLAAAAASVKLLCFASEGLKSHCNDCVKVANGALAEDFSFWH